MDYNPFRSGATQTVQENKYLIPEEIPANERTAFHGAAAAAAKSGKKSFNFGGKSHPVTMKKDLANKIADQKEGYYKDMEIKKQDKEMGAKPVPSKKKKEAKGGGKEGDVEMNPKMEKDSKSTPVEAKESKIRSALRSVLSEKSNRDDHYKSSTDPEMMKDKIKGKGAEDMMKGANDEIAKGPDAHLDEPAMINKDAAKMTSNVPSMKARKNDNMKGDKKIVPSGTPVKEPSAMKSESFGSQVSSIAGAYSTMYIEDYTHEVDYAEEGPHTAKKFVANAKKSGIKAKIHNPSGPGGGHPVVHLGHKDSNHIHKFLKKHYDSGMQKGDLQHHKIGESFTHELDVDHDHVKKLVATAKKSGIKAKIHTMKGPGGDNPVVHLGHKDSNHIHKFLKKHYDPDMRKDDLKNHKIGEQVSESMLGMRDSEKLNGGKSLDPRHKSAAHHIDYHHRQDNGHELPGGDADRHRYKTAKKLGYKV